MLALLRDCTSESMDPRPHFHISTIHITLLSPSLRRTSAPIQIAIVLGVLGTQEIYCIWLQGRLRETIFILHLSRIDKP